MEEGSGILIRRNESVLIIVAGELVEKSRGKQEHQGSGMAGPTGNSLGRFDIYSFKLGKLLFQPASVEAIDIVNPFLG